MIKTLPQAGNLMSCALKEGLLKKSVARMTAFPFSLRLQMGHSSYY